MYIELHVHYFELFLLYTNIAAFGTFLAGAVHVQLLKIHYFIAEFCIIS